MPSPPDSTAAGFTDGGTGSFLRGCVAAMRSIAANSKQSTPMALILLI